MAFNSLLTVYRNKETVNKEITNVVKKYQGLSVKNDPFMFSDGSCKSLVNLNGTIPIVYKNCSYNIPICIWLMDTHPDNAPICYVKPTLTMKIKISQYVDHNGKIYCPYLHEWPSKNSNLLQLIQILITLFGETPPLFQTQQSFNVSSSPSNLPYPTQPNNCFMPMPNTGMQMPSMYPPPNTSPNLGASSMPYPVYQTDPYPPAPSTTSMPTASNITDNTGTINERHIYMSLLSAAEDKVRRRLKEHFAQTQAELQTLEKIQDELVHGKQKLQQLLTQLETKQSDWEKNLVTLRDRDAELEQVLSNVKVLNGQLDIDDAVTTTAPLYNQLVQAYAEEAAAEDAIYYLGEALRRGVIDLDVFLKNVRALARKQFMLRALMHKCRAKAGLPAA